MVKQTSKGFLLLKVMGTWFLYEDTENGMKNMLKNSENLKDKGK